MKTVVNLILIVQMILVCVINILSMALYRHEEQYYFEPNWLFVYQSAAIFCMGLLTCFQMMATPNNNFYRILILILTLLTVITLCMASARLSATSEAAHAKMDAMYFGPDSVCDDVSKDNSFCVRNITIHQQQCQVRQSISIYLYLWHLNVHHTFLPSSIILLHSIFDVLNISM